MALNDKQKSTIKSLAPWVLYVAAYVTLGIHGISTAAPYIWLAGLVLSVVLLIIDKRNAKAKVEHIIAICVGVTVLVFLMLATILLAMIIGNFLGTIFQTLGSH